ncbi:hypothetical protein BFG52_02000 [Acinetobacter larvae]|uniref:Lipoprotein n=2 Tax=Acinetobacter larvae TaxID=1789224 RepID=A0A1B2M3R0_9GAMM|nr:hypothetical protein BFG52_02000 [Acinetobacter larvae]
MSKLVLCIVCATAMTACHFGPEIEHSSFKNSAVCQNQLKDMIYENYKLDGIAREKISFEFNPINAKEEVIQINLLQEAALKPSSVGRIKVNKSENTLFNSTFDNNNLIAIKLDEHQDFIEKCF